MSVSKFESEVKSVALSQEEAYARFSDLNNLSAVRERLSDPAVREQLAGQVSSDKIAEWTKYAEEMSFTTDSLQLSTPLGPITLRVVEREAPKCVKLASEGAPVQLFVWVQLLPHGEAESKLRVTVGAEVNVFMRSMVAKPLQQAAEGLANMLAAVR